MNFHTLLKESIKDESEGIARYEKLAAMAPSEYTPILRDIAKEESQHLKFLSEIADKTAHMDDEDTGTSSEIEEPNSAFENQFEQIHAAMNEIKKLLLDVLDELKTVSMRTDGSDDLNTEMSSVENSAMSQSASAQTIR